MRTFIAIMLALTLCIPAASWAQQGGQPEFVEGKHYQTLPYPVRTRDESKIEVVELFWYGCPHCYDFEPLVKAWLKRAPADVDFWHSPAVFGKDWETHAKAFYAAEAMGVEDKIRQPLFDALVRDRRKLNDVDSLAKFVGDLGVDPELFKKSFNSFGVKTKVDQAMARAKSYRATGVPAIVVNGKYRIDAAMAGSMANMLKVVDFLVAKERAAAKS